MNIPLCALILVLDEDGNILVSSRRYDPSRLNLPGGKIDPEDCVGPPQFDTANTLLQCAIRELREETGLHVESEDLDLLYMGICAHEDENSTEREPDSICATFLAHKWSGVPTQPEGEPPVRRVTWEVLLENTPYARYNQRVWEALLSWKYQGNRG